MMPKGERVWCRECVVKRPSASLGQRLRTFRWFAELSQPALSGRTGISVDNIREYEYNRKKPSANELQKLAAALGPDILTGLALN
jgi:transcriptional regulator with XRE-family HTH domain